MAAAKNIGVVEWWIRLIGGGLLILLGLGRAGWVGWVNGLVGLTLVLTSSVRY